MDDATLGRLFRAFQQADNTVHRTHGGTGLGLSISKALVELWGGRIYARSQLGKSTSHTLTLITAMHNRCRRRVDIRVHLERADGHASPHRRALAPAATTDR